MAQSHQSQKKLQHCKLQKDYKRFSTDSRWSSKSVMESASLYRALLGHLELVQWLLPLNPTIRLLWVSLLKSVRSKSISWISSIDLEQPKKRRIPTPARGPWILTSLEVCRFPQGWKNFLIDLFISIWDNLPPAMLNLDYQGSDQFSLRDPTAGATKMLLHRQTSTLDPAAVHMSLYPTSPLTYTTLTAT